MSAMHFSCIAHWYYYNTFSFIVPQNVSRETLKFEKVFENLLFIFDKAGGEMVLFQLTSLLSRNGIRYGVLQRLRRSVVL